MSIDSLTGKEKVCYAKQSFATLKSYIYMESIHINDFKILLVYTYIYVYSSQ